MRRAHRTWRTVLLAMACVALHGCDSGDLIKRDGAAGFNGGFERTEAGYPVNWAFFPNPESDRSYQVVLDSENVLEGDHSLKVVTRPGEKLAGMRSSQIRVEPRMDYRLSISFRNAGCNLKYRIKGGTQCSSGVSPRPGLVRSAPFPA